MYKHATIMALTATFTATLLFGSEPFPIPKGQLPPAVTPELNIPPHIAPRAVPHPAGPMTLDRLNKSGARGALYHYWARSLGAPSATMDAPETSIESDEPMEFESTLRRPTRPESLATVGTTFNATNDANQDAEPAVIAVKISGNDYTVAATIKYVGGLPTNHVSYSTNSGAFSTPVQLPLPTGYTLSADPLMAVNPYGSGIAPRRIYCVGVLANAAGSGAASAIGVWRSSDGGQTWAGPTIVASQAGGGYYTDKPAIAVSWHSGTLGYVYVTYVNIDETNVPTSLDSNSIWVYRSTDGGLTFPTSTVITYDDVQGPQVVVNPTGGTVHCMWLNVNQNDLRSALSTNYGVSFGSHEIAAAGGNLLTRDSGIMINGNVRAWSLPMARYNWAAGRVIMAYHGRNGTSTEVYYVYRPCSSSCNTSGWENPRQINDVSTNDQFIPGIDFNAAGNVVVTFYDRRNDTANVNYDQYFAYMNSSGVPIHGNVRISTFITDPRLYTATTGAARFIGDYQDVWDWTYNSGENAASAWIGIVPTSGPGNGYISRVIY